MPANPLYDMTSLIRFQMSLLSLGAAVDQPSPFGVKEASTDALAAAGQLKDLAERLGS